LYFPRAKFLKLKKPRLSVTVEKFDEAALVFLQRTVTFCNGSPETESFTYPEKEIFSTCAIPLRLKKRKLKKTILYLITGRNYLCKAISRFWNLSEVAVSIVLPT